MDRPENKKPRLSEVFIRVLRLVAAEHTVLRQRKKYTRSKTNAQFRHGFWRFWVWITFMILSKKYCSCIQYLSILRVFAVSEGAAVLPAQRSPGWNGWCRQCLNPLKWAHCVTSIQVLATGGGKVRQHRAPFNQKETRMSVVDMVILILKLIVAVLQLLDAVLKFVR